MIRTVTVFYPVPSTLMALLTFALGCFGLAVAVHGGIAWLLGSAGGLASLMAFGFAGYAMLHKPGLLRSEHHSAPCRYLHVGDDSDMDADQFQDEIANLVKSGEARSDERHDKLLSDILNAIRLDIQPNINANNQRLTFRLLDVPPRLDRSAEVAKSPEPASP